MAELEKRQSFLTYMHNKILISKDYIKGLEDALAKKEATIGAAQKEEKETSKEQRKIYREQQKKRQDYLAHRAQKKHKWEIQRLAKKGQRGEYNMMHMWMVSCRVESI